MSVVTAVNQIPVDHLTPKKLVQGRIQSLQFSREERSPLRKILYLFRYCIIRFQNQLKSQKLQESIIALVTDFTEVHMILQIT